MLKLKELREEKNLLQKELALKINKTPACISSWETGKTEPDLQSLIDLADCLQTTTDELLNRNSYITGNIEIIGEQLNDKEKQLLQRFRGLDADGQTAFLDIIDKISRMYNKTNQNIS